MREDIHKRILRVETGEVYQPVRLTYLIHDKAKLISALNQLKCMKQNNHSDVWNWYWKNECADLQFNSANLSHVESHHPIRLGTLNIKKDILYIHLPSFKRACTAVTFFYRQFNKTICHIQHADFINKLFTKSEAIPRKMDAIFNDKKLTASLHDRVAIYKQIEDQCQANLSTEEALNLLSDVLEHENKWELPYVERYLFDFSKEKNPHVIFMAFYLFMRSRELVVINRALGKSDYHLADAANESIQHAFSYPATHQKEMQPLLLRAQALFRGYIQHKSINLFC